MLSSLFDNTLNLANSIQIPSSSSKPHKIALRAMYHEFSKWSERQPQIGKK